MAALLLPLVALGRDIRIIEVKGIPADVIKPNGTLLPARVGDHLQQGTTVKTPQRSSVMFLLSNGALLDLQSSSELLIQTFDAEKPRRLPHRGLKPFLENSRFSQDFRKNVASPFDSKITSLGGLCLSESDWFFWKKPSRA
jgi:hypothetical protein